ncbi:hypothetical protein CNR22_20505 [Sphingobacteriaceae bacterium]|nr:hypothetical protein CNR22_20505 [Sphingobacteriaceae bacterium]
MIRLSLFLMCLSSLSLAQGPIAIKEYSTVIIGAQQFEAYVPKLKGKKVAVITNLTGLVGKTSIVDTLLKLKVNIKKIFGPEHGFRNDTEAGAQVKNNKDPKTGLTVISLYGANKKPTKEQLKDIDVVIYDIQDIGVRFYTYISTMAYAMEACAENNKEMIVLDRPNPNGFYIDGPILNDEFKSFLGLHHVPVVYGMTCGEYAQMVNNEGWLKGKISCKLTVITLKNYDRNASYRLPINPSPNIPNAEAVLLYPGLGLFEGTIMSLGRGTSFPFQVIGHPQYPDTSFCFIPKPTKLSKGPRYFNQRCYGVDLRKDSYLKQHPRKLNLQWLMTAYKNLSNQAFFEMNFNYHSGNALLQEQIKNRVSEAEIRESWKPGLDTFKEMRKRYLLYPDFS